MTAPLALRKLVAGYQRKRPVLKDVTLEVKKGSITGLLGRNGAGKTTLMHTALGLKRAWRGRAELFGEDAWNAKSEVRKRVGFVPQHFDDFHWLTVSQCIDLFSRFYDDWDHQLTATLSARWGLGDERISVLTPGLRQRVGILLAIGHRPDLLLLDEPVAALDPGARRDFLRLIGDLNATTRQTVLLSSHICSDIERICSDVAILHDGHVIVHSSIDDLKEHVRGVSGLLSGAFGNDVLARGADRIWLRNWRAYDLSGAVRVEELTLEEFFLDIAS